MINKRLVFIESMPERCIDCPYCRTEVYPDGAYHEDFICDATGFYIDVLILDYDRDEFCPLHQWWLPYPENTPPEDNDYLVTDDNGFVGTDNWDSHVGWGYGGVVAFMPMIEGYKWGFYDG